MNYDSEINKLAEAIKAECICPPGAIDITCPVHTGTRQWPALCSAVTAPVMYWETREG